MDPALVERLTSGEGRGLLESLPPYAEKDAVALTARLRAAGFDAELVAAALTQSRLRADAVAKFGPAAADLLFTQDGLEQATRPAVAARHAQRLRATGVERVLDLGCGIAADALAFAEAGLAVDAVDADEATALIAAANLRAFPHARVQHARAEEVRIPSGTAARGSAVWFDPARRVPGVADITGRTRRIFDLDAVSPSWDFVRETAARFPTAGAKLAPAFPHHQVPRGAEACWTSWSGEVVECALWWGAAAQTPGRSAMVLTPTDAWTVTEAMAVGADPTPAALPSVGSWIYEPDRAVLRAGLVGALSTITDGRELAPGVGYVSSVHEADVPWAARFRVVEAMPFNVKRLRALMRDHGVGRLTVKKRGVSIDPDQMRRQLRLTGEAEACIILTRAASIQVALLVVRV